ncbi:type II CAAX prenyl endopeptidase Rce1 family protein [Paenibacillus apiarius]|uniref:CPBP family glutamic-type intramembrane protease n=1 Tax=Paenibacillus apiarius TaxID=46240 RepID=UPI00198051A5|nr:CPBP family intramembrane metalloprotease [Paenibacillus apiarius]
MNQPFSELLILSPATLVILFIRNLISGPLGKELGWRAFFLTELQKKHTLLKSAIIMGILWGFKHRVRFL